MKIYIKKTNIKMHPIINIFKGANVTPTTARQAISSERKPKELFLKYLMVGL